MNDFFNDLIGMFGGIPISRYEETLNRYYKTDGVKYYAFVTDLKKQGFRIFRNKDGEHKVETK